MHKRSRWFVAAFSVVLLVLVSGCISGERAFRNSPAGSGEIRVRFDSRAVNLWPFYYQNDDFTSVLWPVFDWDPRGFAVRPFFCREGEEYSVLWPLAGWNGKGGWALNCCWGNSFFAAVPLLVWDWDSDYLQAGPVIRFYKMTFVIPVAFWDDSFKNWYFCPVWRSGELEGWGVFPLVWIVGDCRVLGPVWWVNSPEGLWGVFPLAGHYPDNFRHIGPVWWQSVGGGRSHGFFPLYGWTRYPNGFKLNLGYFLFQLRQASDWNRGHFLWPVVGWQKDLRSGRLDWRVWPLVNYNSSDWFSPILQITSSDSSASEYGLPDRSGPFGDFLGDGTGTPCRVLEDTEICFGSYLGYSLSGTARVWKDDAKMNLQGRLGSCLEQLDWLFHVWKNTRKESARREMETEIAGEKERLAVLLAELEPSLSVPDNPEELETLRREIVKRFCREVDFSGHRTLFGLASWYERFGEAYWGQFGFGAVYMRKYRDKSDFRILGYLYRARHDGAASEYLYPPFINVKEEPGRYRWSFLYRVFSYENDDGRKSGHIFFIPWGDPPPEPEKEPDGPKDIPEEVLPAGTVPSVVPLS